MNQIAYSRVDDVLIMCASELDTSEEDFASWLQRSSAQAGV
ncbi:MAG TPA: hypothetical protein VJR89_14340 [Polyangiales bacterium]|nr:hypothetical protein [Polyangiales bacterium]